MKLKCPICKQRDVALGDPDFPFCSERCRLVDLGKWAAEEYRIPVAGNPLPLDPAAPPSPDEEDD